MKRPAAFVPAAFALVASLALAACGGGGEAGNSDAPGDTSDTQPFARIAESETVHFTGTEPFWGGEVSGDTLTYSAPEDIEGTAIAVTRFAGRGGVSFSGTLDGASFDLSIGEGECSDGMSERTYPFHATLKLGEEIRDGCAWSDGHPVAGPESP